MANLKAIIKRLAEGAAVGANAYMAGDINALKEKEAKKAARNKALIEMLTGQSKLARDAAMTDYYNRGNQPKLKDIQHGFAPDGSEYNYDPNTGKTTFTGQNYGKPAADRQPSISIGPNGWSASNIPGGRAKEFAIKNDLSWNTAMDGNQQPRPLTGSQLMEARTNLDYMFNTPKLTLNDGTSVDNPKYNPGANIDSAIVAQTAPLNPGGAVSTGATSIFGNYPTNLNSILSGGKTAAPQAVAQQPFTPAQAAFTPDMNDLEIQKAYQALKSGQITQEVFDDFAKQRMGQ